MTYGTTLRSGSRFSSCRSRGITTFAYWGGLHRRSSRTGSSVEAFEGNCLSTSSTNRTFASCGILPSAEATMPNRESVSLPGSASSDPSQKSTAAAFRNLEWAWATSWNSSSDNSPRASVSSAVTACRRAAGDRQVRQPGLLAGNVAFLVAPGAPRRGPLTGSVAGL